MFPLTAKAKMVRLHGSKSNDKPFTQADLDGISQLGDGSKKTDLQKVGQYGVGFNCVSNITEPPMFLTTIKEQGSRKLAMFDPHLKYVNGATAAEPGRLFDSGLEKKYPDVFSPFKLGEQWNWNQQGTIFRLPLRTLAQAGTSEQSMVHGKIR